MTRAVTALVVLALAAAACGGSSDETDADRPTVSVFGPYQGVEADNFIDSLAAFTDETGIKVRYTGSGSFVADLERRVIDLADPPDVALIPQRGLIEEFVEGGLALPLPADTVALLDQNYDAQAAAIGIIDGTAVGVPYRASVKSIVWYRPDVFDQAGYSVPRTLAELEELAATIEADGTEPWCLSIEAQGATGWVATDWTEDLLLRLSGTEVYDAWIEGSVGFDSDEVRAAFTVFDELALRHGRPAGGTRRVLSTPVREAHDPLFEDPPGCLLHHQASFAAGWLPDDISVGPDGQVDVFLFPGVDEAVPPLLVGADLAVAFNDSTETQQLLTYLATPQGGRVWAQRGGHVSFQDIDEPGYYHDTDLLVAGLLRTADELRLDASDSMRPAIGSDLLWSSITDWVAGGLSYDEFAAVLDEARAGESN